MFIKGMALSLFTSLLLGAGPGTTVLRDGWAIQAAAKAGPAAAIASPGFRAAGWYPARVPATVLGALVDDGIYKDPFLGRNLEAISPAPFQGGWWYRTEFQVSAGDRKLPTRLLLDGVNYRASVWLNGHRIAGDDSVRGTFRTFDLDLTRNLRTGANALAILVQPPAKGDFTMGFVDWNPEPPDKNMGLFREVKLKRSGPVSLEHTFVSSNVDLKTLQEARLTITAELVNHQNRPVAGTVTGEIGELRFQVPFALKPLEHRPLTFSPEAFPMLAIHQPRLWWPANLGSPEQYQLKLSAAVGQGDSDRVQLRFGIRQVDTYLNEDGNRGFIVNGRKVLIRGGGWVDDLFLREDPARLEAQFRHIRNLNLNTIRLEGFWGASPELYDLADRNGILVMVGVSCQWEWPEYLGRPQDDETYGAAKSPDEVELIAAYLRDQVLWLRQHPSILVWVLGSDKLPWPDAETRYRADLKVLDPTRPVLASTKGWTSTVSGPTGVKMLGPYDYVTPNYWFEDTHLGGAYGFNCETGPGPQVPPVDSLRKMIPAAELWPPAKATWDFHCGRHEFNTLDRFQAAFTARYGPCAGLEEFAFRTQAANYEAMRAMYEAFGVNQPKATGVIQWMLNASWPKLYWQLYDYYLTPNGAYYGARKGNQPLTAVYDCAHRQVHVVNDTRVDLAGASVRVRLLDAESRVVLDRTVPVACAAGASVPVLDLKDVAPPSALYFLDLRLQGQGRPLADNFYWLSAKPDVLDYPKSDWACTPLAATADFRGLGALPPAAVTLETRWQPGQATVTLGNPTDHLAFFLELGLTQAGQRVVSAIWDDNDVCLLPHETRVLHVTFTDAELAGRAPRILLTGWNVPPRN
jgi:exo-1,4-beta-D-glucosaminidase